MSESQAPIAGMADFVDQWLRWATTCPEGEEESLLDRLVCYLAECGTPEGRSHRLVTLVLLAARRCAQALRRTSSEDGPWGAEWVGEGSPTPAQQLAMQLVLTLANGDTEAARDLLAGFLRSAGVPMVSELGGVFLAVTDLYDLLPGAASPRVSWN